MKAIGFDPSLRAYGWALYDPGAERPRNRRVDSGHEGTLSSNVPVARYIHFRALVRDLLRKHPDVDVVGIESPAYGGGPFQSIHFGLMLFSLEAVFEARKNCVLFDPVTLKKLATGSGTATKTDMQRRVQMDTMSIAPIQSDEADAYCVARAAARFMMLKSGSLGPGDLEEAEKEVFLEKTKKRKSLTGVREVNTAHLFRENSRYFEFSRVPVGSVDLPEKTSIPETLLVHLESKPLMERSVSGKKTKTVPKLRSLEGLLRISKNDRQKKR